MVRSFEVRFARRVLGPRGRPGVVDARLIGPHRSPHSVSRALSTLLAVVFLLTSAIPVAAGEDPEPPTTPESAEVVPGEVVVKWRDAERGPAVARARGLAIVAELGVPGKGMPSLLSTEGRGDGRGPRRAARRSGRCVRRTELRGSAGRGRERGRGAGERSEDCRPVLARPDDGPGRLVAREGRIGRGGRPRHRRAGKPPRSVGSRAARLRLREQRHERRRRQRAWHLGGRHHRLEAKRRLWDRRRQLERQDPAGQGHDARGDGRHGRPDRRDHLGGEPRCNGDQHERGWLPGRAVRAGRRQLRVGQGRGPRRSGRQQQPRREFLSRQASRTWSA